MAHEVYQRIKFLDVGHGDSSIIHFCDADSGCFKTAVIDISDADKLITALQEYAVKVVDMIIISHFDADHCKGVNDFIEKYSAIGKINSICYNIDRRQDTRTFRYIMLRLLELYRKNAIEISKGIIDTNRECLQLMSNKTASLSLIYPNVAEDTEAYLQHSSNNMSIVCLYESDTCNVIFPGDLENDGWMNLFQRMPDLKCDILKMPHHGAFYSEKAGMGTDCILNILQPKVAIISTRENKRYKHPSAQTIKLIKEKQIECYCTQYTELCNPMETQVCRKCYGDVEITITDLGYVIKTEKNMSELLEQPACAKW